MLLRKIAASLLSTLFFLETGYALTIDSFSEEAVVSSTSTLGAARSVHVVSSGALGGGRSLTATKSGAGNGATVIAMGDGSLSHTQGFHGGSSSITWDGDRDPTKLTSNGLGSVDLTQDGGTALVVRLQFFNYPLNTPIDVAVRLYDAGAADGSRFSEVALHLAQPWMEDGVPPLTLEIPFDHFKASGQSTLTPLGGAPIRATTTVGPNGPSRINAVGAISMFFRGESNNRSPYVILKTLTTNGRCVSVPSTEGRVVDECGVCSESPHHNGGRDRCGICFFGPGGYSYLHEKVHDGCGICPGESNYRPPDGNRDECGVCFSGLPPYSYRSIQDVCGVCGGGETSVSRCSADTEDCSVVAPTSQILGFEKLIVAEANKLRARFLTAQRSFTRARCSGSLFGASRKVAVAHHSITTKAQRLFQGSIAICNQKCATISYATRVNALTAYFRLMERENLSAARKVERCYQRLGKSPPAKGSPYETNQAIGASRSNLKAIHAASSRARVCRGT